MEKMQINPALKNMFFSMLEAQTMDELFNQKVNTEALGKLKEIVFILHPKKKVQQVKWTKKIFNPKVDEVDLTDEQVNNFLPLITASTLADLFIEFDNIIVTMDFQKQTIFITKKKKNGEKTTEEL